MQNIFIAVSSVLALISPIVYIRSILSGESKPHRTTRLVLLLITALSTFSLLVHGDRVAVWLAGISFLQAVAIFVLSFKYGMGGTSKADILCLLIALLGIVMWQTTDDPRYGLYFSILADATGMVPALLKTYRFPETEYWLFYGLDVGASIFTMLAISAVSIDSFAYPIYIFIANCVMVVLILRKRFFG